MKAVWTHMPLFACPTGSALLSRLHCVSSIEQSDSSFYFMPPFVVLEDKIHWHLEWMFFIHIVFLLFYYFRSLKAYISDILSVQVASLGECFLCAFRKIKKCKSVFYMFHMQSKACVVAEIIWQKTMIIDKLINGIILFKAYGAAEVCKVTN